MITKEGKKEEENMKVKKVIHLDLQELVKTFYKAEAQRLYYDKKSGEIRAAFDGKSLKEILDLYLTKKENKGYKIVKVYDNLPGMKINYLTVELIKKENN